MSCGFLKMSAPIHHALSVSMNMIVMLLSTDFLWYVNALAWRVWTKLQAFFFSPQEQNHFVGFSSRMQALKLQLLFTTHLARFETFAYTYI